MAKSLKNKNTKTANDNTVELVAPTTPTLPPLTKATQADILYGFDTATLKSISLLASSILFAAPAFATQANPTNIIALADMFEKFCTGGISVGNPTTEQATTPTFG